MAGHPTGNAQVEGIDPGALHLLRQVLRRHLPWSSGSDDRPGRRFDGEESHRLACPDAEDVP